MLSRVRQAKALTRQWLRGEEKPQTELKADPEISRMELAERLGLAVQIKRSGEPLKLPERAGVRSQIR